MASLDIMDHGFHFACQLLSAKKFLDDSTVEATVGQASEQLTCTACVHSAFCRGLKVSPAVWSFGSMFLTLFRVRPKAHQLIELVRMPS